MKMMRITTAWRRAGTILIPALGVSFLIMVLSCEKESSGPTEPSQEEYHYTVPEQTDDGWETDSLAGVGMDPVPLIELMDRLAETEGHEVHGLLIVKDGKLVFEEYFPGEIFNNLQYTGEWGYDRDDRHNLCSVAKSFTSALVGIAIDKGLIGSVDEKVFDFFPEHADLMYDDPLKADLTIEDLLTMRSGIDWDDETYFYDDPRNDLNRLFNVRNPVRFILFKDILVAPGTVFEYSNCNSVLLGDIVRRVSEKRLDEFSEDYLFSEIGVDDFEWQLIRSDVIAAYGDLQLRPRDMAKFGLLFLNGGTWNDRQVISPEWIELSTREHVSLNAASVHRDEDGYAYHWWRWESIFGVEFEAYMAQGWGEQRIIVWPEKNMVIVTTAGNFFSDPPVPIQVMLVDHILPAVESGQ